MSKENGLAVFSLRLPEALAKQIDERAKLSRRPRNYQIVLMLEQMLDLMVQKDLRILEDHHSRNTEEKPSPLT